jgi:DNA-directed RNA polymerase specialized sigma subunit
MQALLDSLEEREAEVVVLRKGKEEVLKDMRAENRNGPVFRNLQ